MYPILLALTFGFLLVGQGAQARQVCSQAPGEPRGCYEDDDAPAVQQYQPPPVSPEVQRRRDEVERLANEGNGYYARGDWQNAIRDLQQALALDPGNAALKTQLDMAQNNLLRAGSRQVTIAMPSQAELGQKAFDRGDWDNAISDFQNALKQDPDNAELKRELGIALRANSGHGVVDFAPHPAPHQDTAVVDTRGVPKAGADMIAQVPELANSPAADRIRKGYQAVMTQDWKVALAWWQEAAERDPKNGALRRSVELAQWMASRQNRPMAGATSPFTPALDAVSKGDDLRATALLHTLRRNPVNKVQADLLLAAIQQRVAADEARARSRDYDFMAQFYLHPMAGTALAHLVAGDSRTADEIFARIEKGK